MPRLSASRRFRHDFARALSWHRRKLAVLAAVGAVLAAVGAAAPAGPATVTVVRATERLPGGSTIASDQVAAEAVPESAVPDEALTDLDAVVGRTLLGPASKGSVITGPDVVSPSAARPGFVLAPLRLADAEVAALLHAGDRVDVLAAEPDDGAAARIARAVPVLSVPVPSDPSAIGAGTEEGGLLLVEVSADTATRLAAAAVTAQISVVLR